MAAKNNNKTAWIIVIIAVIILAVIAIVTTIFFGNNPEKTIDETFAALKEGNMDALNKYITEEEIDASLENEIMTGLIDASADTTEDEELTKACFIQLEWKINETERDGNTAVVNVDITNKDFSKVVGEVFSEMLAQAFSSTFTGREMTEEDITNLFKEKIEEVTDTTTATEEINLVKENGIWKFTNSDELVKILLPGLSEKVDELENSLDGSYDTDNEYNDSGI